MLPELHARCITRVRVRHLSRVSVPTQRNAPRGITLAGCMELQEGAYACRPFCMKARSSLSLYFLSDAHLTCSICDAPSTALNAQLAGCCRGLASLTSTTISLVDGALREFATDPGASLHKLIDLGVASSSIDGIAHFLYCSYRRLPARAIGQLLTVGDDETSRGATPRDLTREYTNLFDLSSDTPVQALRRVLDHTRLPNSRGASSGYFRRIASRYVACHRQPSTSRRGIVQPVRVASAVAREDQDQIQQPRVPFMVHGLDVSSLDAETVYVILYSCVILNQDMRSSAIDASSKLSVDAWSARNASVSLLAAIPHSFWRGCYEELAIRGLPLTDESPVGPVHAVLSGIYGVDGMRSDRTRLVTSHLILRPLVDALAAARSRSRTRARRRRPWRPAIATAITALLQRRHRRVDELVSDAAAQATILGRRHPLGRRRACGFEFLSTMAVWIRHVVCCRWLRK